ncbi:MAG: hypothetical protein FWH27_04220 [Planctomycetaceae bacterium]|nr:hypothetical protein [Planctomycetaceae bacterium]
MTRNTWKSFLQCDRSITLAALMRRSRRDRPACLRNVTVCPTYEITTTW